MGGEADVPVATAEDVRAYLEDMIGQMSRMAEAIGDAGLAAALRATLNGGMMPADPACAGKDA